MDRAVLDAMCQTVVDHIHPRRIVLFGSQARGDAGPDSDVDLLVVEDVEKPGRMKRWADLRRALPKDYSIDLVLTSESEWERWSGGLNHLFARAAQEGKVLYERP